MVALLLTVTSVTLYALAAALGAHAMVRKLDRAAAPAKLTFLLALIAQSIAIGFNSVSTSGTLISGPNILMLAAWVLALAVSLLVAVGKRSHAFVAFGGIIAATLIVIAQVLVVLSTGASPSNDVYHEWPTLVVHVVLILLGTAAFAVSSSASVMQLYQQKLMRQKSERFFRMSMPALSTLESLARRCALVGLTLFSAGLLIGLARLLALYAAMAAVGCEGSLLYLTPRIGLSLAAWLLYAAYLLFSYLLPHIASSRLRAGLSACGLVLAVVLVMASAG